MVAESEEAFRRHIGSLSESERVAFVADLLAAQGHDVEIEGRRLDVTEADRTRTFVLGKPPAEVDPDVVVLPSVGADGILAGVRRRLPGTAIGARLREWVTGVGLGSDTTLIEAEELRLQLLYAVDRSTADALVREHFGTELQTPGEDADAASTAPTSPLQSGAVVVSLALLIGLFGGVVLLSSMGGAPFGELGEWVSGEEPLGEDDPEQPETVGPLSANETIPSDSSGGAEETTEEDADDEYEDLDAVANDHRTAIESVENDSVRIRYQGPSESSIAGVYLSGDGEGPVEYQLRLRAPGSYTIREQYTAVNGSENTTATDGNRTVNTTVERYGQNGTERKENGTDPNPTEHTPRPALLLSPARFGTALVTTYLDTEELQRRERGAGLEYREEIQFTTTAEASNDHELVATGPPRTLQGSVEDYRAVAIIRSDGLVERMEIQYTDPDTDSQVVLEIRLTRFGLSGLETDDEG